MTNAEPSGSTRQQFADLVAHTVGKVVTHLAPERARQRDEAISAWLEGHEADAVALVAPILAEMAAHPDMPAEAAPVFDLLLRPEHQTQAILTVLGVYPIVSAFVMAAVQPFVQDISNTAWSVHSSQPLSPAEAALAALRGNWSSDDGARESSLSGLNRHRYDILELNTGEPPGLAQLLESYRRHFIDKARLERGIKQSRVRNEWVDVIEALRYAPVSAGEVLAGLVQGHLELGDATERIAQAGVDPSNMGWLYETHGRPPGVVELGELVNRGEMSEGEWEQAVRESDIKNKYIPFLQKLHRRLMPERTVVSAVRQGVLPRAAGYTRLRMLGLDDADANVLLDEASHTKTQHTRELSESQTISLYADRLISRDQARIRLAALNLTGDEIDLLLILSDHAHTAKLQTAGITRVHTLYVTHKIDHQTASTDLDVIGIDHAARDDLLKVWTAERAAAVRTLSISEMQGLAHRNVWTYDEFRAAAVKLGYDKHDARLLYILAFPPTHVPKPLPPE